MATRRNRLQERQDFNRALAARYPGGGSGWRVRALTQGGNWTTLARGLSRRGADERAAKVKRVYPGRYRAVTVERE